MSIAVRVRSCREVRFGKEELEFVLSFSSIARTARYVLKEWESTSRHARGKTSFVENGPVILLYIALC
jgi:hypothetical protein